MNRRIQARFCSTHSALILTSGAGIRKISPRFGHSDIEATEVYLRASPAEKLAALEINAPPSIRPGVFTGAKDDLMRALGRH